MSEKELEIKEVKEAINTLREYCINCGDCDNCDTDIQKWCEKNQSPNAWRNFNV